MNILRSARAPYALALLLTVLGLFSTAKEGLAGVPAGTPRDLHIITACRIYDSRPLPGDLTPGTTYTFDLPPAGPSTPDRCGVPTDAVAVIINATIISDPLNPPPIVPPRVGYVSVFKGGTTPPGAGVVSFEQGDVLGQFLAIQLGEDPNPDLAFRVVTELPAGTFDVAIDVLAFNGSGAPSDILLSDNTVEENQPAGTLVGTFSTADPDFDDTHTYTLVAGTGSEDNAEFQISGNQLLTNAILDLKGQPTYSIRVRSTDHPFGVFFEKVFIISADNVNEAPAGTDGTISVSENGTRSFTAADFGFTDPIDNPDNNFLAVVITTLPTLGSLKFSNVAVTAGQSIPVASIDQLTFTPAPGANGPGYTSFTFQVQDDGGTANGGIDLDPSPNTLTIDVNSVNDAPVGTDNTVTINEDGSHTFTAAEFGFSDPNDSPADDFLAVRITTLPTAGSLTLSGSPVSAGQSIPVASIPNLTFTPAANASGLGYATFTFQVQDDGGTAGGGVDLDQSPNTFTFNVTAVNDPPAGTDKTVTTLEDTPYAFTAADFGFTDPLDTPANALQAVVITTLPTAGSLTLSGSPVSAGQSIPVGSLGNLTFTPAANASGTGYATFTFQVRDDGGTANGGIDLDASANTITIDVTAVNDEPTLDPIADPADVNEDAGLQTVNLTGIGAGGAGTESSQTLTVTAVSSNPALIPNPTVVYTSPNATGSLSYTPVANQSGTAVITVTVQDDGGTANGGDDTIQRTFTVDVLNINDEPTLDPIADPADILEDAGLQTVSLTGIAADALGVETTQTLTVTAVSSNPGLIPNPTVTYTSPNATGSLSYTPVANQFGTAVITVTVQDNGGTANGGDDTIQRTFTVDVLPVNDEPTLNPIADPADINEDAGLQTVNLTGIGAGGGSPESSQTLTVTAVSSNPGLIPNPTVTYTSPNATGSLSYTPVANQFGTAIITVTVQDNGGTANGGDDTIQRTFTVDVLNINDEPTLDPIADPADILEDAGLQTVNLTGIGPGGAGTESSQVLTVTAVSSNPGLIPNPTVVYTSPNATGSLSYTPVANQFGTAVITVTVQDNGGTANGGDDTIQRTFTVDVLPVNDAPSFTGSGPVAVNEDSGAYSAGWAAGILAGPPNESGQTLTFLLTPDPGNTAGLFSVAPSISSAGVLTFTPALNKFGTATYTVVLQDNGGTANGGVNTSTPPVSLTITVNPVNDAPVADNDKFDYIGNTELRVDLGAGSTPAAAETTPTTFGVVDGDSDPVEGDAISVSSITVGSCTDNSAPFDCTDPAVGTVHMQPNGRFSFEPAPGDTGSVPTAACPGALDQETFQYTLTDNGTPLPASTIATVTLCRFARVWFVDPAGAAGNGSSTSPLNVLTTLNGAGGAGDVDGAGDYIFIHSGTLAGTIELESNQHLVGRGAGLSIPVDLNANGSPTVLVGTGTRPQLTNASGDTVRVTAAIPADIVGLSLASTTGNAIDLTAAAALTGSGTLTIGNNQLRGSGAEGIDVNLNAGTTGTLTLNVTNNSWDAAGTHTGNAVDINRAAGNLRLNFSNNTGILSAATAVNINGGAAANTTITGFANNAVHQGTAGAGISVTNATFDADPAAANLQTVSGGTTIIGVSGDGVGGGLLMSAVSGELVFTDLDIFTSSGAGISVAGTGPFTGSAGTRLAVGIGVGDVDATGGPAAAISNATIDLRLLSLRSASSASTGVSLTSVDGTFSAPSGATITNAGTTDFVIDSSSAAVTYDGTITDDVGQLVQVTNSGGSNKLFRGAITDGDDGDGSGISLTGNSSLIRFSGGVVLSTGANAAFTATGGGTVEVCDEEPCNAGATGFNLNKITTTTATALNVANTTIGANNLEFRSISAGTGAGSGGVGISLDSTGTAAGNGGLVVRGTGTAGSGGTIQHKTGADGSTTAGLGIYLNRTRAASFSRMQLNDFDNFAIRANEIVGLTLSDVVVSGLNGNSAAANEGSIFLEDAGGTIAVSSANVSGGFEDNLRVLYDNATAGPAAVFNVTGSTFRDLQAAGNNSLVNLVSATAAATGWDVDFNFTGSCVFENDARTLPPGGTENFADAILVTFEGPFQHSLNVQNATFHHLFQAMDIASNFSADVAYTLKDNTITFTEGVAAIAIGSGSSSTSQSLLTGLIQGNNIGTSGVAQSGNRLGLGIAVDMRGEEIAQFTVHGNNIRRTEVNGIQVIGQTAADGNLDIQITNNNIAEIEDDGGGGAGVIYGIEVTTNNATSHDICLDARNNDSFNINAQDIRVRQSNAAVTFAIEGLTGNGASDVNVENYLISQNPGNTADVRVGGSIVNYTSVANCTTPPIQ